MGVGYHIIDGVEYYYSGENGFSTNPIRWIVVGEDSESYTLLQEFVILGYAYESDINAGEVTYGSSGIRKYINSEGFLNIFFRDYEQKDILTTNVSWEKDTSEDKLYLPSSEELLEFFPDAESRKAHYYDSYYYGKPNITTPISGWGDALAYDTENCTCAYWTRTSNLKNYGWSQPTYISCDGGVCCGGRVYYTWSSGIRPMMRVKKNSAYLSKAITSLPKEAFERGSSDMALEYGKYAFDVSEEIKNTKLPVRLRYIRTDSGDKWDFAVGKDTLFRLGEYTLCAVVDGITSKGTELSRTDLVIYPQKPVLTATAVTTPQGDSVKEVKLQWGEKYGDYIGSSEVEICRSDTKDGEYTTIYTGSADYVSGIAYCGYTDKNLEDGKLYWYKVRALYGIYNKSVGKTEYKDTLKEYESRFSEPVQTIVLVSGITLSETDKELYEGDTIQLNATVKPNIATDKSIEWKSKDTSVATVDDNGVVTAVSSGSTYIYAYSRDGSEKRNYCKVIVKKYENNTKSDEETEATPFFGWYYKEGKSFWYENGIRQGTMEDANGVMGTDPGTGIATNRGREIYDPESDGWYWLDSIYDGAKAVGKEVWMPYIYQDEANWRDNEETARNIAYESDEGMGECVLNAIRNRSGKWVRYDENGKMLKGWVTIEGALADLYPEQAGNTYYYDNRTGLMAKGEVTIGGQTYHFDETTGALR